MLSTSSDTVERRDPESNRGGQATAVVYSGNGGNSDNSDININGNNGRDRSGAGTTSCSRSHRGDNDDGSKHNDDGQEEDDDELLMEPLVVVDIGDIGQDTTKDRSAITASGTSPRPGRVRRKQQRSLSRRRVAMCAAFALLLGSICYLVVLQRETGTDSTATARVYGSVHDKEVSNSGISAAAHSRKNHSTPAASTAAALPGHHNDDANRSGTTSNKQIENETTAAATATTSDAALQETAVVAAEEEDYSTVKLVSGLNFSGPFALTAWNVTRREKSLVEVQFHDRVYLFRGGAAGPDEHDQSTKFHQVQSYRRGTGMIVNIHPTHHAGTTFCATIGGKRANRTVPRFNCMFNREERQRLYGKQTAKKTRKDYPWTRERTAENIHNLHDVHGYHMVSWEFQAAPPEKAPSLADTDWENTNFVSALIVRDPISRLLAGDGYVRSHYGKFDKMTEAQWWHYAKLDRPRKTDNFALGIFAGRGCCDGERTDPAYLERAKELLRRFTVILDIACLDQGLVALAELLGIEPSISTDKQCRPHPTHPPSQERIPYPEVYDFLLRRNRLDIELYEWARRRSLVDCSQLGKKEN